MDSVDERGSTLFHEMSHGLIGSNHKFFNDLMSQVSLCSNDVFGLSLKIEDDLGFWKIKIKSSSVHPFLPKSLSEIGHPF